MTAAMAILLHPLAGPSSRLLSAVTPHASRETVGGHPTGRTQNRTSVDRQRLPCGTARSSSRALLTGTRALWGYR